MSDRTEAPFHVSRERKLSMPLAFLLALLAVTAAGAVAWTSTREQVARNTSDIQTLQTKFGSDHDLLVEIRADIKNLMKREGERK